MTLRLNWFIPTKTSTPNKINFDRVSGSIWIRCLQLIPYFNQMGIDSVINDLESDTDISIFVRWQNSDAYETALKQKSKGQKIIFDLCVNYFDEVHIENLKGPVTKSHINDCKKMVSVSDVITCASKYIANRASEYHSTVEYLPDSIDSKHFNLTKNILDFKKNKLSAIWSGVAPKSADLNPIIPILKRNKIDLKIISNYKPRFRRHILQWFKFNRTQKIKWSYKTFPSNILKGEFCVAPRTLSNTYNKGHSFFKVGVFLSQGIPAIASPVPSYHEVLQNNVQGRICENLNEWDKTIQEIKEDPNILVNWSNKATKSMQEFHTSQIVKKYSQIFNQLQNLN